MKSTFFQRLVYFSIFIAGLSLFGISTSMVADHVRAIADVRDVSVPLVAETVQLERRTAVLNEQVELAELQGALRIGSHEERVHVFVLPETFEIERLVALYEVLGLAMEKYAHVAQISPLELGEEFAYQKGLQALPLHFSISVHEDGMHAVLGILKLAGMVTVADALSPDELQMLFERIEAETPAGIVALEQFLSLDLMTYASEPRTYEEDLKRSFLGSSIHPLIEDILKTSLLSDAKTVLGGPMGHVLQEQKLWPTPFLAIQTVDIVPGSTDGWYRITFEVHTYHRTAQ